MTATTRVAAEVFRPAGHRPPRPAVRSTMPRASSVPSNRDAVDLCTPTAAAISVIGSSPCLAIAWRR